MYVAQSLDEPKLHKKLTKSDLVNLNHLVYTIFTLNLTSDNQDSGTYIL